MTVRSRYAQKPTRRRAHRDDTRRAILLTITFVVAIAVSLSLVGGVFAANYYADHGAPVASVNGEAISKDQIRDRVALNLEFDKRKVQDYLVLRNQGNITPAEYSTLSNPLITDQTATTHYSDALNQLSLDMMLRQYAGKNGLSATDQQVKDQIQKDATIPELRHVLIIGVAPVPTPPASSPSAQNIQAAKDQAQVYVDQIKAGSKWADVSTISEGGSSGATKDFGITAKDDISSLDPDIVDSIFSLAKPNDLTPIFKGSDGIFRFATVTSIVAPYVDPDWQSSLPGTYQSYAQTKALQELVKNAIEKKYIETPTVQRHVLDISIGAGFGQPGQGDEVKIDMMTFAPNHSASTASSVAATDPAWADAKTRADAAFTALRADPSKFDSMARDTKTNDDPYFNTSGGAVPWIPSDLFNAQTTAGQSGLGLTNVQAAVFAPGLVQGMILDPIQETSMGYVVIKFEGRRAEPDQRIADAQLAIAAGTDFATVAQQYSEAGDAASGADFGWVSPYQLTTAQQKAIFEVPVGGISRPVSTSSGFFLYKVTDQQTRLPDAAQAAKLKRVVFATWVAELQSNTNIWTDQAGLSALNPASATP